MIDRIWRVPVGIATAVAVTLFAVLFAFVILPFVFLVDFWNEIWTDEG